MEQNNEDVKYPYLTVGDLKDKGHNPDSQCVSCCGNSEATLILTQEIHSALMPLIRKIDEKVESFDMEKLTVIIEKLSSNSLIKMLMK